MMQMQKFGIKSLISPLQKLSSVVSNQISTRFDKIILRKEKVDLEILVLDDKKFMLTID